jgi:hypothetical protein
MLTETELAQLRETNNPTNEPIGHFTGRCGKCGSKNLWDDYSAYGCDCCGAIFFTGDMMPQLVLTKVTNEPPEKT